MKFVASKKVSQLSSHHQTQVVWSVSALILMAYPFEIQCCQEYKSEPQPKWDRPSAFIGSSYYFPVLLLSALCLYLYLSLLYLLAAALSLSSSHSSILPPPVSSKTSSHLTLPFVSPFFSLFFSLDCSNSLSHSPSDSSATLSAVVQKKAS